MELLAVRTARFIVFFPTEELNPRGRRLIHDFIPALIERYDFKKYPDKPEDYDDTKGIRFEMGRWNESIVSQLVIYSNGILAETSSSTDDAEAMLKDALAWASESFKIQYRPDMLNRKGYLSEILVKTDIDLENLNPAVKMLCDRLSASLSNMEGTPLTFAPAAFNFAVDALKMKIPPASFRLERLAETPFSDMKYYSQAPLPTEEHIKLLGDFEAALKA